MQLFSYFLKLPRKGGSVTDVRYHEFFQTKVLYIKLKRKM